MAQLTHGGFSPIVAFLLNGIAFFLWGQKKKAFITWGAMILLSWLCGLGGIICLFAALDAMAIAKALQAGEPVDENEYRNELFYKIAKIVDKEAVLHKQIEG